MAKMNIQDIKKYFVPWFTERGFVPFASKRLFCEDHGYYLIFAEISPCRSWGFYLSLAVHFFWHMSNGVRYQYTLGDESRLRGKRHSTFGEITYDTPYMEDEIKYIMGVAEADIEKYRELDKLSVLYDRISNRIDFISTANKGFRDRDADLAIAEILSGENVDAAEKRLLLDSQYSEASKLLLEAYRSGEFESTLVECINQGRANVAKKHKLTLPPITADDLPKR